MFKALSIALVSVLVGVGCSQDPATQEKVAAASVAGESGKNGANGDDGTDGRDGRDGTNGVQGVAGEKGEKGDKGEPGVPGQSIKGDKGDTGEPGPMGPMGPAGMPGESIKGDKGDVGPAGPKGDVGLSRDKMYMRRVPAMGTATAMCTGPRDIAINGGCAAQGPLLSSYPSYDVGNGEPDALPAQGGWVCVAQNVNIVVSAFVTCLRQ